MRWILLSLFLFSFQIEAKGPQIARTESVLFLVSYDFGKSYQDVTWAQLPLPQEDSEKKKWILDFENQLENSLLSSGYYLKHLRRQQLDLFLESRFKKKQLQASEAQELQKKFGADFVMFGTLKLKEDQVFIDVEVFEKNNFTRVQRIQLVEKYKGSLGEVIVKSLEWNRSKNPKET